MSNWVASPRAQRARLAEAATALESHLAVARQSAAGLETEAQIAQARGIFLRVIRLVRGDGG